MTNHHKTEQVFKLLDIFLS